MHRYFFCCLIDVKGGVTYYGCFQYHPTPQLTCLLFLHESNNTKPTRKLGGVCERYQEPFPRRVGERGARTVAKGPLTVAKGALTVAKGALTVGGERTIEARVEEGKGGKNWC